ncbi:MAG: flavodoxin [Oscillospiraceae bacterium]
MKRLSSLLLCTALAFGITACSNSEQSRLEESNTESVFSTASSTDKQESETVSSTEQSVQSTAETESTATAESSVIPDSGTDTTVEPSDIPERETDEKTLVVYFTWSSNTEGMAETIAELTEGDIFEIVPVKPYPTNYNACVEVALAERDSNSRPEILNLPQSISECDNIIIGYPIWWHTAPMIIGTFLESYDLTGIDVYPFSQSASMDKEQFAQSMDLVRSCSGNGIVHDGLFAKPSDTRAITEYLEQNGLI